MPTPLVAGVWLFCYVAERKALAVGGVADARFGMIRGMAKRLDVERSRLQMLELIERAKGWRQRELAELALYAILATGASLYRAITILTEPVAELALSRVRFRATSRGERVAFGLGRGRPRRGVRKALHAHIRMVLRAGFSQAQAARICGTTPKTVRKVAKMMAESSDLEG